MAHFEPRARGEWEKANLRRVPRCEETSKSYSCFTIQARLLAHPTVFKCEWAQSIIVCDECSKKRRPCTVCLHKHFHAVSIRSDYVDVILDEWKSAEIV